MSTKPSPPGMIDVVDRLTAAALTLFTECGYAGTSVASIGRAVGLAKTALYYHYASKDELLLAVVAPALDAVDRLLDDPPEGRRDLLVAYADTVLEHRKIATFLGNDLAARRHPDVSVRLQAQTRRFEQHLGVTSTEGQALLAILLGIHWRPLLELPDARDATLRRALHRSQEALLALL